MDDAPSRATDPDLTTLLDLFPGDDQPGAAEAAGRLVKALEPSFNIKGKRLEVGASIGVAVFPGDGVYADTLMRKADEAMYKAKRAGGGFALNRTG